MQSGAAYKAEKNRLHYEVLYILKCQLSTADVKSKYNCVKFAHCACSPMYCNKILLSEIRITKDQDSHSNKIVPPA